MLFVILPFLALPPEVEAQNFWQKTEGPKPLTYKFITSIAFNDAGDIFAGAYADGVFRSSDGNNWVKVNNGLTDTAVWGLVITSVGDIFAATSQGLFRSSNNGDKWIRVTNTQLFCLTISHSGDILAGAASGGVYYSPNNGDNWVPVPIGLTTFSVQCLASNALGHIFAGTYGGVFRSMDRGSSWASVSKGLTTTDIQSLVVKASGEIFAGTNGGGVFRSMDNGNNWMAANTGLTWYYIGALTVNASDHIFAGSVDGEVFQSANNGNNWTAINSGLTGRDIRSIAVNSFGYIFAGTDNGVFKSVESTGAAPTIINSSTTNISPTSVTFVGMVNPNARSTTVEFQYGTTPTNYSRKVTAEPSGVTGSNPFSASSEVSTLSPNTIYYFQIVATNELGKTYGAEQTFKTNPAPNRSPELSNSIPSQTLLVGGVSFSRDLNASPVVFTDPDGDALTYTATSGAPEKASASLTGSVLTVTPVDVGRATITVTANDGEGGTQSVAFTVTVEYYPSTLSLSDTVYFPVHASASDYQDTTYRIVGLPGVSNLSIKELLVGQQNKDWQVFWDTGADKGFFKAFDGTSMFLCSVGRAFWIINKGLVRINRTVQSAKLNSAQEIELPLHSGWNLITNPFTTSIAWSKIQSQNNIIEPIWTYKGFFSQSSSFDPYVGYYLFATKPDTLEIPYTLYSSSHSASQNVEPTSWRVHITYYAGDFVDKTSSLGIASEASPGLDRLDFRKPRAIAATPTVEFKRPEWDANYSTFTTDIRPEIETSESWEFEVRTTQHEASQLTFSGISKIPSQFKVYLIDDGRARTVNLRKDSLYRFTPAAELSKFCVLVGKVDAMQEKLNSVALPKGFTLGPNYPNPFNPTTTIPVAIPVTSEMKLKIYNILGEEVKVLYDGTIEAGRYWFNWDGRNEAGTQVATGVYLYRLTTNKKVNLLSKMILIR